MNETNNKSLFTVKKVMRVFSVICLILVFCPSFLVSCSGQSIKVSTMTGVAGLQSMGETIAKPHPILLICLILPIIMIVHLFSKKKTESKIAYTTAICAAIDLIVYFIFKASVKKIAKDNMCKFKVTGWYTLNIISLLVIIVLSVLVIVKVVQLETDLVSCFTTPGGIKNALNQVPASAMQIAENIAEGVNKISKENVMGYCSKCGKPLLAGNKFCVSCGTAIPESIIEEFEASKKKAEEEKSPRFCSQCGKEIPQDAGFCAECGAQVE